VENERAPDAKITGKGHDRRAEAGTRTDSPGSVDRARAHETGDASTPGKIPPRGWRDIFWRVFWSISEDRIPSTSGRVAFFGLLAVFPGSPLSYRWYGLFADASTIGRHLSLLTGGPDRHGYGKIKTDKQYGTSLQ
jgi:membrane protein